MKILVVEDDAKVSRFLVKVLHEEGYATDVCKSGVDAIEQGLGGSYDVILLDWMLPDLDGVSACRELRRLGLVTPILMLTARDETGERVLGLEAGADDYVSKPFEIEELLARIRALLRRASGFSRFRCGDLEFDRLSHRAWVVGAPLDLTAREYGLLVHLAHRPDRVVSRSELLAEVWGTSFDPGTNLVEVHVSRLREKLAAHAWMIETVRGAGYRLRTKRAS